MILAALWFAATATPQVTPPAGAIRGTILDPSGAVIPNASVVLMSGNREMDRSASGDQGDFHFDAVPPGRFEVRVESAGFAATRSRVTVGGSRAAILRITMPIAQRQDKVTVAEPDLLDVETDENSDTVRLGPEQLADLPIMNGDVMSALSALLGPAARGAGGASVIVDGLPSDGARIPLSDIQEIRINNNPYSAEFMRPGKARVEIITKSGSSEFHGSFAILERHSALEARNAFDLARPPRNRRQFDGNVSGPVHGNKKDTFALAFSHSGDNLEPSVYAFGLAGPIIENASHRQTSEYFSGQYTHRIADNALSFRYTHFDWSDRGGGTGGLVLPEAGIDTTARYNQLYSTFRSIVSPKMVNVLLARLRIEDTVTQSERPGIPQIAVGGAFIGGSSPLNKNWTDGRLQLGDTLSWSSGRHLFKAGINLPSFGRIGSTDRSNFAGTFTFSTLADYAAGRPLSFIQNAGSGHIVFWDRQVGGFLQDEVRLRPNLSVSLGARYDWQNYGAGFRPVPRLSVAWAPGKSQKTVIRAGAGFFYDVVPAVGAPVGVADTLLMNGVTLRQIQILDPGYPNAFSARSDPGYIPLNVVRFDPTMKAPYSFQYSVGIERRLRKKLTLTSTWASIRGVDLFRSRDVNAPFPPFYATSPDPMIGMLRQIETSGGLKSYSIQTTLRGNFSRFFSGMAIHEWGRSTDDTNGIDSFPANNWSPQGEWARAGFDTRNFFYLYGTLSAGKLFRLGLIFSANSGRPYNMVTGYDEYHDGLVIARPAGVPRNSLRGTGSATLDIRWSREFRLRPKAPSLTAAIDAFNLFNQVNYSGFVGNVASPFFGRPISALPARRVQLSLSFKL